MAKAAKKAAPVKQVAKRKTIAPKETAPVVETPKPIVDGVVFYSVSFKKPDSTILFNVAVFDAKTSEQASTAAKEWMAEKKPDEGWKAYGVSRHEQEKGTPVKGVHVIMHYKPKK